MTSAGQQGRRPLDRRVYLAAAAAAVAVAVFCVISIIGSRGAGAATTEWVVTDPRTGLAIDGYDPVAYFLDSEAVPGKAAYELAYQGVVWRFRNPGNQGAFKQSPADYEPQFGGYDPVAIGRGVPTPGNPLFWLIADQRLYLFRDPDTQARFKADPNRLLQAAETRWRDVTRMLSR